MKDRLLSCTTKSLDRIAQNPLVEESISSNRLNPAWDRFPTPLSVVRPVSPYIDLIYWGDLPKACHCLKQAVQPIRGHVLAQSTDYEIKTTIDCPGNLTSEMHIASPSDTASGSSLHYFAHIVKVKFVLIHLLTVLTKHACQHNSFWGSRCVSSPAPTISLKPVLFTAISALIFRH